jgi:hypothetical protein
MTDSKSIVERLRDDEANSFGGLYCPRRDLLIEAADYILSLQRDKRMVDDLLTAAVADYNGVLAVAQEVRTDLVREFGTTDGDINEIVRKLDSLRALSQGEQS